MTPQSGTSEIDLGVPGLRTIPTFAEAPQRWTALERKLANRPFLHAEGLSTVLGAPQLLEGKLLQECQELVRNFDEFYRTVIEDYYQHDRHHADFLVNPLWARVIAADRDTKTAIPLGRFDCVLTEDGELRVIELNAVGVCTMHLRATAYLSRAMSREGMPEARLLDRPFDEMVESFRRFRASEGRPEHLGDRPSVGVMRLSSLQRGTRVTWRQALIRHGWRYVDGSPSEVKVTKEGLSLHGTPIEVLWGDWIFYLAYQYERYQQTKWASKFGDYSRASDASMALLENDEVLEHFRSHRVLHLSPPKAYLSLSKNLLSWIHRADRPAPGELRPYLRDHVARTYSQLDRQEGAISLKEAQQRQKGLLLKPCQYGGSHGVQLGCETPAEQWSQELERVWNDPGWALQEFSSPRRTPTGQWISLGLYSYGGELGGVTIRTSSSRLVSARQSVFIPVIPLTK